MTFDFSRFLVVKWDWIEEALSDEELETLYHLLSVVTDDKPDDKYYVISANEPYIDKLKVIIERGDSKISREELLASLRELAGHGYNTDVEATHAEADELILRYLNDPEVEKAFEDVPRWYS